MFGKIIFIGLGLSMIGFGLYQIIGMNNQIEDMRKEKIEVVEKKSPSTDLK